MSNRKYTPQNLSLVYSFFERGESVDKASKSIDVTESGLIEKLRLLARSSTKWKEVLEFWGPQYFSRNKGALVEYRKNYYKKHKKAILQYRKDHKNKISQYNHEYYMGVTRNKPYKELGDLIKEKLELKYEGEDDYINRFANELGTLNKNNRGLIYLWIAGKKKPKDETLNEIAEKLNIDHKLLEETLNRCYKNIEALLN